jgi:hypothetical protein
MIWVSLFFLHSLNPVSPFQLVLWLLKSLAVLSPSPGAHQPRMIPRMIPNPLPPRDATSTLLPDPRMAQETNLWLNHPTALLSLTCHSSSLLLPHLYHRAMASSCFCTCMCARVCLPPCVSLCECAHIIHEYTWECMSMCLWHVNVCLYKPLMYT